MLQEEEEEERALDLQMEIDRLRALEAYEERERQRMAESRVGAQILNEQIVERKRERVHKEELRDLVCILTSSCSLALVTFPFPLQYSLPSSFRLAISLWAPSHMHPPHVPPLSPSCSITTPSTLLQEALPLQRPCASCAPRPLAYALPDPCNTPQDPPPPTPPPLRLTPSPP